MIKRKPVWVLLFAVLFQYPVSSRCDVAWTGLIINIQEGPPVFHGVYLFRNIHVYSLFTLLHTYQATRFSSVFSRAFAHLARRHCCCCCLKLLLLLTQTVHAYVCVSDTFVLHMRYKLCCLPSAFRRRDICFKCFCLCLPLCARVCVCVHMWMCVIAYYLHKYLLNTHQRQQQQLREESHNTFANGFIKVLILRAAEKFKDKYKYRFENLLIIQLSLSPVHRLNYFKLLFLLKHIVTHMYLYTYVQSDQMVNRMEN